MTQLELVKRMSWLSGLTQAQIEKALRAFRLALVEEILRGGKISLRHLGTFRVLDVGERRRRNPKTGQVVSVPASRRVSFRAGDTLRDLLR